jgi:hypothetical protein
MIILRAKSANQPFNVGIKIPPRNAACRDFFLLGILIFKGLTALRLYKSFGVKGLNQWITGTLVRWNINSLKFKEFGIC